MHLCVYFLSSLCVRYVFAVFLCNVCLVVGFFICFFVISSRTTVLEWVSVCVRLSVCLSVRVCVCVRSFDRLCGAYTFSPLLGLEFIIYDIYMYVSTGVYTSHEMQTHDSFTSILGHLHLLLPVQHIYLYEMCTHLYIYLYT